MRYDAKHRKRKTAHYSVWIMRFAALLGCLTLISAYLLSGVYSKFYTSASGGDSARVACFSPSFVSGKIIVSDKTPGYSDLIEFSVNNTSDDNVSEVAMKYKIVLKTTGNIPLTFTLTDSAEHPLKTWECNGESGECVYEYADASLVFNVATKGTDKYKLKWKWPDGKKDARFSGMTDAVYLSVEFEQID